MRSVWEGHVAAATELRHRLHRNPELAWSETSTAATIRAELDELGIPWRACAKTGTIATLGPGAPGRTIALRADIDGLPIQETSGVPWQSEVPKRMHACGHDGHTATLIAAARWLQGQEARLPGPVRLLFQPAEEGGHGARGMIEDGALEGVDVIFGWHNWPAIPEGHAVCPDGLVMCANGGFTITLTGHGGHASQPELARDPVLAAAAVTLALQQVVSRRSVPQEPAVVSVTSISAESGETIIPDRAVLNGSIRAASLESRARIEQAITEVATATASAHRVEAEIEHRPRYGATINHAGPAAEMRAALEAELGQSWRSSETAVPLMASEDFSYYLREIPGAFALIGAGSPEGAVACHNSKYDFNDRLIPLVARVYARLAGMPIE